MKAFIAGLLALTIGSVAQAQTPPAPAPVPAAPRSPGPTLAREIARFAQQDTANPAPKCAVLFVGSSSIRRWNSLEADMRPMTVINRGIGGSQISHINGYFDQTVGRYQPKAIVFYAGDNDLNAGKTPAQVLADLEHFLSLKDQRLGATPVYVISAKPSASRLGDLPAQREYNKILKRLADRRKDVLFLNIFDPMMQSDGQPKDLFVADKLHMTSKGYDIWIRVVKGALDRPPPTRAPGC
jgi:hypothetical protein